MKMTGTGRIGARSGIALIVVMLVIVVLAVLASAFAYSMKVEAALARNSHTQTQLEWTARSAAEMARFLLGETLKIQNEPYDAMNQYWAGGPMGTNDAILAVPQPARFDQPLEPQHPLGVALFDYKIEDLERFYNVNIADDFALRQALIVMQAEDVDGDMIIDSILDWIDPDDATHMSGNESEYYERLDPPYMAKNGPIDDMTELLLIRGITPELFWGPDVGKYRSSAIYEQARTRFYDGEEITYPNGFANLFTAISASFVNVNTAASEVFQLVPGVDENMASAIIMNRSGPDGIEGTEQDIPFRSVGELATVTGLPPQVAGALGRVFSVRSATFRVTIKVAKGEHVGTWIAVIRRDSPTDVKILTFYRES
ncbi:MAG: type II secretory pathway component PulK [Limisphaerales bacterium]|jgi:type II secretory pathway component PulK